MRHLPGALIIATTLLAMPAYAVDTVHPDAPIAGTLAVGSTGIHCYRAPCPWRGIVDPGAGDQLIWSRESLPAIAASPADQQSLETAWTDFSCLIVEGAFDGTTLTVTRLVRNCS